MTNTQRRICALLACLFLAGGACSSDDPERSAAGDGSTSSTAPEPAEARAATLVPSQGPLQAGTYASAAFDPLAVFDLGEGWTVQGHAEGVLSLAFDYDPNAPEEAAFLTLGKVTGSFDVPFLSGDEVSNLLVQQSHVRPLPEGGVLETLGGLPGVTVGEVAEVDIAGVTGQRAVVDVGALPQEAVDACGGPPGCVLGYDNPGPFFTVFVGGSESEVTTFEVEGATYALETVLPEGSPTTAEALEDAEAIVVESLAFGAPVELDEQAVLDQWSAGLGDLAARPFALALTAPGSPARIHMSALYHDAVMASTLGQERPAGTSEPTEGGYVVSFEGIGEATFTDIDLEGGLVSSFTANGRPMAEHVADFDDDAAIDVGGLRATPLETYVSPANGTLWIPMLIEGGDETVDVSGLRLTHVADDGTERPMSTDLSGAVVLPHLTVPYVFLFADASLGGRLVVSGTVAGGAIAEEIELPEPS